MMRYFATVVDGFVSGVVSCDMPEDAPVPVGTVEVTGHETPMELGGHTYDGDTFTAPTPAPRRVITRAEFIARITLTEHVAFETMAQSSVQARVWWNRLMARDTINLDAEELIAGLAWIKSNGIGMSQIWPDAATADARIAAIRGVD